MRIGILGGTFDPIHNGHLILARDALEALDLHKIVFIPSFRSPHKLAAPAAAPAELRAAMVRAAIHGEPRFEMDEIEIARGGASYTIDTLLHFRTLHPDAELFQLVGEDNLPGLPSWRRIEEISMLAEIVILARAPAGPTQPPHSYVTLHTRRIDISSTEVRARIAKGLSIRYLLPQSVITIIQNHQLYREEPAS